MRRCVNFKVMRHGEPIERVALPHSVNTGIAYSSEFEQWEAATSAGLDMSLWEKSPESGGFSIPFKAKVIAWFRLHKLVRDHAESAAAQKAEREMKSKVKK